MHRFFVDGPLTPGAEVSLAPEDAAHAARVLRLSPGDVVIVCDGRAYESEAELERVSSRQVTARVNIPRKSVTEPAAFLTLAQGVAKGAKMDFIIQKAVEIGVSRIIPVVTERTVVRMDGAKAAARVERWQRIAYEAAKQAHRAVVPHIEPIVSWRDLWCRDDLGIIVVPWEEEAGRGLLETVKALAGRGAPEDDFPAASPHVTIVIGPEGGVTAEEIALAKQHGARPVTLGPRILRTETAGIVAATLVLGALGELG